MQALVQHVVVLRAFSFSFSEMGEQNSFFLYRKIKTKTIVWHYSFPSILKGIFILPLVSA
ncbi:hypothetical protein Aconfl_01640 [Algoriphagus confluentis]|uniref:Uncharacterized protein n=1 Tax=Algoriphagus confluentis TaxID=1697556 RepID=A0ABQ6PJ58_9BACT|nr:hypothetical protein Aconfl_01640 [Algoriphagus confluentis]